MAATLPPPLERELESASVPRVDGARARPRIRIGQLWLDALTFDEGLEGIRELVGAGCGGTVFTPNVDHVVMAESNAAFRDAYAHASLAFADGTPLIWFSRLAGTPLPAKLSGSDMILPIARLAARERWRVYLLGGASGTARGAARRLEQELAMRVAGIDESFVRLDDREGSRRVVDRIRASNADLLLVAFGAPKQELWIDQWRAELAPTVAIGVGGSFDFVTGRVQRAPRWISGAGLEWLYRLAHEPRRLWRRYLVQDPAFVRIAARTLRLPRASRVAVRR